MVVVGGGFTGMWAAWHLMDLGATVAVLEGGVCGHGPSGRNGGFCESLWLSAEPLRARFGDAPARALLDASSRTVGDIGDWCRDKDVDAWFDQSGYMCVSTAPGFDSVGERGRVAAAALGAPDRVAELDRDGGPGPLRLPSLQARRADSRLRHPPPRAPRAGPAQSG